ncbi:MAG: hypothetical protein H7Z13_16060 [Ferruginibacter sp.]|nr:hypothetical protein [Ferruginibacter sp.]
MKKYCITALSIFILQSCSHSNKRTAPPRDTIAATDSFFPVTSFIKGQIITLGSLPVTPLQLTTINEKTDSLWIPKKELMPLLLPFLTPVINETNFTKYFKETKFKDQTINAITFTYDPINIIPDSITLRRWDVYIDPETGNVIKVFIVKNIKEYNQIFTQQLTWKANKLAKITTILNKPGGDSELIKEVVFIWDFADSPNRQ